MPEETPSERGCVYSVGIKEDAWQWKGGKTRPWLRLSSTALLDMVEDGRVYPGGGSASVAD